MQLRIGTFPVAFASRGAMIGVEYSISISLKEVLRLDQNQFQRLIVDENVLFLLPGQQRTWHCFSTHAD